jgi:hypothetical protein
MALISINILSEASSPVGHLEAGIEHGFRRHRKHREGGDRKRAQGNGGTIRYLGASATSG